MFQTMIGVVAALVALPNPVPAPYGSGPAHRPQARLTLSYMADAGFAEAVKLDCGPVGGGHPLGAQVCATLDAADGDPDRIPPSRTMCFLIYAPIEAQVSGTWQGKTIEWEHRYGNACEMRRATGVLFAF
jgi:hypothetical protein